MASNNQLQLANDALSAGHITKDEYAKIAHQNGAISDEEFAKVTAPGWKRGLSSVGGFGLETGGMIAGEVGGGALGLPAGPVGVFAGKTAGGAVGEAGGEVLRKELDTALGFRKQPSGHEIMDTIKGGAKRGAAYSAIGQGIGPLVSKGVSAMAKPFSLASGMSERTLGRVAENPRMILPEWLGGGPKMGKQSIVDEVGNIIKKGTGEAENYRLAREPYKGLKLSGVEGGGVYSDTLSKSKAAINDIDEALGRGEKLVAKEAIPAYEWVNSRLKQLTPQEGKISELTADAKNEYFALKNLKGRLQKEVQREAPEFWDRIVKYAQAKTKEEATQLLTGGYGGRYVARRTIPVAAGLMGPQVFAGVLGAMSPAVQSGITAAGSAGGGSYAGSALTKIIREMRKRANPDSQP